MAEAGPFPEGSWLATLDNTARPVGRLVVCVDVSWNRAKTYIARAGHDQTVCRSSVSPRTGPVVAASFPGHPSGVKVQHSSAWVEPWP